MNTAQPSGQWKLVKLAGRSFCRKDGKYLVVGDDGQMLNPQF